MAHTKKSNLTSRQSFRLGLAFMLAGLAAWALFSDNRFLSRRVEAAGFVVTNTNDSGAGSLRSAMLNANGNGTGTIDTITFNIPGAGVHTIKPLTELPALTTETTIDGYSQPGSSANTLDVGNNAVLLIEIDGSQILSGSQSGVTVKKTSMIKGLVIHHFETAIVIDADDSHVRGNFIGTDPTGTQARGNLVGVDISGTNNDVGWTTAADRNLISGNKTGIASGTLTKIFGNYIGTNAAGTAALPNTFLGVALNGSGDILGNVTATTRNVISGNAEDGIAVGRKDQVIQGNFIGTTADGASALGNGGHGITNSGSLLDGLKIGGTGAGAGNLISANGENGISLGTSLNVTANNLLIQGNYIGTNANGADLGNLRAGIRLSSNLNIVKIGGTLAGEANVIAFNHEEGVAVFNNVNTVVSANRIFANGTLGIDLFTTIHPDGVTPNDAMDVDSGPNDFQNFPVLTSAVNAAGVTSINGTLNSKFNNDYNIEFFVGPNCDASGHGEGENYLGRIQVTTLGFDADFTATFAGSHQGMFITATATGPGARTSEFSKCIQVTTPSPGTLQFSQSAYTIGEGGGNATITVRRTGGSLGAASVQYASVPGGSATVNADYTPASGTLNWANGDVSDKTFSVPISEDSVSEANETVSLSLSNAAGAALGNPVNATLTITDNDAQPAISIADVSEFEGNTGTTDFTFNVTLSPASGQAVMVDYASVPGTASAGSDYLPVGGKLTFAAGETSKTVTVVVKGDTDDEPTETFTVQLSNPGNATLAKTQATGKIMNDDSSSSPMVSIITDMSVHEGLGTLTLTVGRGGSTANPVSVDYMTVDNTATQKGDYEFAAGTVHFGVGEFLKKVTFLINEDSLVEGKETFLIVLKNPVGASLGNSITGVDIFDDQVESPTSPLDDSQSFVHMHYHDFLNREPDAAGLQFWTNQIESCGNDAKCREGKRLNVSAAFFLSIEFQETGYLRYLLEKESFGTMPKYAEFMRDIQEVGRDVIVNQAGWEQKLKDNQEQFAEQWASRPAFKAVYDGMSNAQYVNALYSNAGLPASQTEQQSLVNALDSSSQTRTSVLLDVARNATFRQNEQSTAFVMMEYFGYLRRDPNAAPDSDLSGYNFWLNKLSAFGGDYLQAEMVKAFITSSEYRQRFGQ